MVSGHVDGEAVTILLFVLIRTTTGYEVRMSQDAFLTVLRAGDFNRAQCIFDRARN